MTVRPSPWLAPATGVLLLGVLSIAAAVRAGAPEAVTVTITKSDCRQLVKHEPAPDVAYRAGVDVYGRPVAPADLDGGIRIDPPETIVIDVEVDLFRRFGIPLQRDRFDADAQIGAVVYRDGRAYFNGQPLQDEAAAELAERCQRILRGAP